MVGMVEMCRKLIRKVPDWPIEMYDGRLLGGCRKD